MIAALSWSDARELTLGVAAIIAALVVVLRFFGTYIFGPLLRALDERTADRLDEKLEPLLSDVARIKAEVTYNGGSSLKDAVRRTELDITALKARMDEHFPKPGQS